MSEKVKIFAVTSPQIDPLCDQYFLPSLKRLDDPLLDLRLARINDLPGNGDYATPGYFDAVAFRCNRMVEVLSEAEPGEIVIFSDVDVVFLARFRERLLHELGDADVAFMDEFVGVPCEVNFGFIVARRTTATLAFFVAVRDAARLGHQDSSTARTLLQPTAAKLLPQSRLKWRKLSKCFANTNTLLRDGTVETVLFHAICTAARDGRTSMQLKEPLLDVPWRNRTRRELVIARHREDLGWTHDVDLPVLVYDKSPRFKFLDSIPLENSGREADTYLRHILSRWNDLADVTVFSQGDPHFHAPDFNRLAVECDPQPFADLSRLRYVNDGNGMPTHPNLPVADAWCRLWPDRAEPKQYGFGNGAIFAVRREAIRSRPREFYERMLSIANEPLGPWVVERLWAYVWANGVF